MNKETMTVEAVDEMKELAAVESIDELKEYNSLAEVTKRAISNTLKLMNGKYGGGFYVKYLMDEGTCYGWLNLVVVYPDGTCKSIILYKNWFRETDTEEGNGVYNPPKEKPIKGGRYVDWDGDPRADNYVSLAMYETPQMPIPARTIWAMILEYYEKIPIVKISQSSSIEQLVTDLQEWAEAQSNEHDQGFMSDESRFYVTPDDFRKIVEENGWTVSQARTELDMQGLFDKDAKTRGYQKTKRVGNATKRFYVIRKTTVGTNQIPKSLADVTYKTAFKGRLEKEIEYLKADNMDLVKKYNDLAAKIDGEMII